MKNEAFDNPRAHCPPKEYRIEHEDEHEDDSWSFWDQTGSQSGQRVCTNPLASPLNSGITHAR